MATKKDELFATEEVGPYLRIFPIDGGVVPKTFAATAGAELLAVGTPVAFDTAAGFWKVWEDGGLNELNVIRGFVFPKEIQLDDTDEVIGTVFTRGRIHRDDIVLPTGETQNGLDDALRNNDPSLRELDIDVEGLAGVR